MFKKLHDSAYLPEQAHQGDAGFDLKTPSEFTLNPHESTIVWTGITVTIPKGHVGLICPRSGLAAKHHITVLNAPGIIDQNYTGELGVILINHGETKTFKPGDKIAQLVITPAMTKTDGTQRGTNGFGSTGE